MASVNHSCSTISISNFTFSTPQFHIYRIFSNRSRVSNTSRESDYFCSNRSWVSNTSRVSNRSSSLMTNTIELMVLVIGLWCVVSFATYYSTYQYMIMTSKSSKKRKIYTLKLKLGNVATNDVLPPTLCHC